MLSYHLLVFPFLPLSFPAGLGSVLDAAQRMVAQGAHMLDVGGQSTRPGAQRVAAGEELARVMPVIRYV